MARKNYAQQRLGWHRKAQCKNMKTAAAKWLNSVLWSLCVEERCDTLPPYIDVAHLAHESGLDVRTVRKSLEIMQTNMCDLIRVNEDKTITVFGVREAHETAKWKWKDGFKYNNNNNIDNKNVNNNVTKVHENPKTDIKEDIEVEEDINVTVSDLPPANKIIIDVNFVQTSEYANSKIETNVALLVEKLCSTNFKEIPSKAWAFIGDLINQGCPFSNIETCVNNHIERISTYEDKFKAIFTNKFKSVNDINSEAQRPKMDTETASNDNVNKFDTKGKDYGKAGVYKL